MTRIGWALCLGLALLGAPGAVHGQAADPVRDRAAARALFEQGVAAVDRGDLAEAEDRFRRSLAVRESTSGAFNLAMVLVQRGALVEAQELFRTVATTADAPASIRAEARGEASRIEPRLAHVTVALEAQGEVTVELDGRALSSATIGVPLPVDPGVRTVVARRSERTVFERTVELEEGGEARVVVAPPTPDAAARSVLSSEAEPAAPGGDAGSDDGWVWGIVIGAVVAGLLAGGIVLGVALTEDGYFVGNVGPGRITID